MLYSTLNVCAYVFPEWVSHMPKPATTSEQQTKPDFASDSAKGSHNPDRGARSPAAIPQEPSDGEDCMDLPTYVSLIGEQSSRSTTSIRSIKDVVVDEESPEPCQTEPGEEGKDPEEQSQLGESATTSGLTCITVRPSDVDRYRGKMVLVLSSNHNNPLIASNTSNSADESPVHHVREDAMEHCDATQSLKENNVREDEYNEEEPDIAMPLTQSMDDESENVPLGSLPTSQTHSVTPAFTDDIRREQIHHGGLVGSKIMKRSSSLISDSGIESEPSSVAWPVEAVLRGRTPLDFSSEREILQQMARRHPAHRSSLEGLQMESNGSLPSGGIQASLTSISSLPYEEDQQQRQLSKLTKSVSAPQISSPEDDEKDQGTSNQETDTDIEGTSVYEQEMGSPNTTTFIPTGLIRHQESSGINHSSLEDIQEGEQFEVAPLDRDSALFQQQHTAPTENGSFLKETVRSDDTNPPEFLSDTHKMKSVLSGVPEVLLFQQFVKSPHVKESAAIVSQVEDKNDQGDSSRIVESVDERLSEVEVAPCSCATKPCAHERVVDLESNPVVLESQSFHPIQLLDLKDREALDFPQTALQPEASGLEHFHDFQHVPKDNSNTTQRPGDLIGLVSSDVVEPVDLKGLPASEREPLDYQSKPLKIPSSGLAFMNKKVVEVVNMSVSCAPTCLPFSSVLRDSPSVSSISARQATSPITHQPLGSFGIISSSSSNALGMDDETNERMLK